MSFKFVYGKAGTGKSKYIYDEIKEEVKSGKKIYIITPEQFSFTAEKKLVESVENKAVVNAEVLTFKRMAYRVMNEVGGAAKTKLSKCGKAMILYNILNLQKDKFNFLGKSEENIEMLDRQITELKKHTISVEDVNNVIENTSNKYLKSKLEDILFAYTEFENTISNKYLDDDDSLAILVKQLESTNMFDNSIIYIDEFLGFTKQEYNIIKKLFLVAKKVTITICTNSLRADNLRELDIFYTSKQTVSKILDIVKEIDIKEETHVNLNKVFRFKNDELKHLEENIYAIPYKKYNQNVENIKIFLANNQYSEIENIASQIVKLVKFENYQYKDIVIISKELSRYSYLVRAIFNKYGIPIFIDEKKDLNQNIIVKYLISIIDIFAKNWSYEAVLNYVKTGFLDFEQEEIFELENYCLKWGIKNNKWYKDDWNFSEESEKFNNLRKRIVEPLMKFKDGLKTKNDVRKITEKLFEFLKLNKIDEKFFSKIEQLREKGEEELVLENEASWKVIIQILDELVLVFGDEKVEFERYMQLFKIAIKSSDLGKIPATQDQVVFADVDRSRSNNVKAAFIIGLNDGVFPSYNRNEGFLNDDDREELKSLGIELAKGSTEKLYEDNFNIYKTFTVAEEKIFLSYASSDIEGKSLRPSILISKLKKIYPNLKEESDIIEKKSEILIEKTTFDELLWNLGEAIKSKQSIDDKWLAVYKYYLNSSIWNEKLVSATKALVDKNIPEKISTSNIDKLYGDVLKISISKLEKYKACPFSYYLKYGLKLSENSMFEIKPIDTGSFMHEVIDEFFTYFKNEKLLIKEIDDILIQQILENILNEKLNLSKNYIFMSTPKYKVLTQRLKNVIFKSVKYIVESIKCSNFEVASNEEEFKKCIKLDNGKSIEIVGKIDRIDIAKIGNEKYIRIIDYKSSIKNIELNQLYQGLQLQLLTYLDVTCEKEDGLPAGALYFNLIDPIIKSKKSMTVQEIEDKIKEQFKMKGLILADIDVIKSMDKTLETKDSKIVPVYISKEGEISNSKSSVVTSKQFQYLQKYVNKLIRQISKEILQGNIEIKPYYNLKNKRTPCEYCEYKVICNFNSKNQQANYNYLGNMQKEAILEMIKEDIDK